MIASHSAGVYEVQMWGERNHALLGTTVTTFTSRGRFSLWVRELGSEEVSTTDGFTQDREGILIYKVSDGTGYILVSDQQANAFRIYTREGEPDDPHNHRLIKVIQVSTNESDGSDVTSAVLDERFPSGLFVAMSDNRTFQLYSWDDIAGDDLVRAPNGIVMP